MNILSTIDWQILKDKKPTTDGMYMAGFEDGEVSMCYWVDGKFEGDNIIYWAEKPVHPDRP